MIEISVKTSRKVELVDIGGEIRKAVDQAGIQRGVCSVFVPHTTAGITINENADPNVARDILFALNKIVPDDWDYHHLEGNADAHIKSSLIGSSVTIIIENGSLQLGTWQGIYFCEFDGPRTRYVWIQCLPA